MPGGPDPAYLLARRALLDGLEALAPHLASIVVVGAQALYLHTGSGDLAVAEFTTDADLALSPEFLASEPAIGTLLEARGFRLDRDPGKWRTADGVQVDLLVPDAVAGPGRRGARLPGHGKLAARRTRGIEGALVDNEHRRIGGLAPGEGRAFRVRVAGPAALLVAKVHKISERAAHPDRLSAKDALDVLRLLQATPTEVLAAGLERLRSDPVAATVTEEALVAGARIFSAGGAGLTLVTAAVEGLADPSVVRESLRLLWADAAGSVPGGVPEDDEGGASTRGTPPR